MVSGSPVPICRWAWYYYDQKEKGITRDLATQEWELQLYPEPLPTQTWAAMPLPKAGDSVKISMLNGETIEGVVEWIDGNGAWVKSAQRSRWVPLEALQPPPASIDPAAKQESDSST